MNVYGTVILVVLLAEYALSVVSSTLNLRSLHPAVPREFDGIFDATTYARSQEYTRTRTRFGLIHGGINLMIVLAFWQLGGFEWWDQRWRSAGYGPVGTGLLYIGSLGLLSTIAGLPFRLYSTFVIEERYGFNRTTWYTFVTDLLKGLVLAILLGGSLLTAILWLFEWTEALAWLWCWLAASTFLLIVQLVAPTVILPFFNEFTPLESGELHEALLRYARNARFPIMGIFVVDGSRRSSKANAFFTGIGRHKRIGLFDTLVRNYTVAELVAVVAHEIGHYKKWHIWKGLAVGIAHMGAIFFVMSLCLNEEGLFEAFHISEMSVYAGLLFFSLLFTPVELALSVLVNAASRRNEFEADAFAARTTGSAKPLISALKKLSGNNLTNLTPHPFHAFLHYSHPPVLQRIAALREFATES